MHANPANADLFPAVASLRRAAIKVISRFQFITLEYSIYIVHRNIGIKYQIKEEKKEVNGSGRTVWTAILSDSRKCVCVRRLR